jgi:dTDP-4-amino-4,6-dideoxygalactose transaminase
MTEASLTMLPFVDLEAQRRRLQGRVEVAIQRVLEHGQFIMGPEVSELEERLAGYCGARHAVTCGSGTDALLLALMAHSLGAGDAVVVPSFTFPATPEVVSLLGATPLFVDVLPDTFNIDPSGVVAALDAASGLGVRPRAMIAVDLFGQPADYDALEPLCRDRGLVLVADAAQSFGARWGGRKVGTIGDVTCASFFPAKPLGCYGDGGALFTDDDEIADALRSLRAHGRGRAKYDIDRIGINGRLDTIQAAVLLEKLTIFDEELTARRTVAARYDAGLAEALQLPIIDARATSAWAQYTVQCADRDALASALHRQGIPTAVHYPRPLHQQLAYADTPAAGTLSVSEKVSELVLSLPVHPYLDATTQDRVIDATLTALP